MKKAKRASLWIIFLGLTFLVVILLRSFILENIITPLAIVLWLFWRIFRSVDQNVYWGLLILAAVFYAFIRLVNKSAAIEQTPSPDCNATLERVTYWQTSIRLTHDETETPNILKHNLGLMLATLCTAKQTDATVWKVYEELKLHPAQLPEDIGAFLFPAEPTNAKRSIQGILNVLWQTPGKRIRRWTGREVAEYYQSIEQVINYMDSSLEIKHDTGPINTHNH